ncbi:hypothetical protein [Caballeronia grimmiae]|uniref:Uncharacterized protein n=1 Tax=Caballeronia grimmiae TaxID=1071679 RepID=A0A069NCJ0_9BURK|nr:hypothetical protein [Caballeronia grimmiae]KDR25389.1 hypothetical protein BG57_30595 [Caballeronia grimmiae]GGD98267.1 hypothetical protein GCM10010985_61270 [Caballeronia grimmiae]
MVDGYSLGVARQAQQEASDWKAYAARVERAYSGTQANEGVMASKDALLKELARVDPTNYLLVQANRQAVFDAAYDKFVAAARR